MRQNPQSFRNRLKGTCGKFGDYLDGFSNVITETRLRTPQASFPRGTVSPKHRSWHLRLIDDESFLDAFRVV